MPNTIRFYVNFTPNLGRGQHYYFDDVADYLSAISSHALAYLNNVDNYRVTSNLLRIPYPITQGEQINYEEITYLSVLDERINLYRFYHVKAVTYLSNYLELTLQRDLWADYIALASLDHIFVQRCNRMPVGVSCAEFDPVAHAKTTAIAANNQYIGFETLEDDPSDLEKIWVVFTMVYQTYKEKTLFGGTITTSSVAVFGVRPVDYVSDATLPKSQYIEYTINSIARIYGISTGNDHNDAYVSNVYIVHQDFIPIRLPAIGFTFLSVLRADFFNNAQLQGNLYTIEPSYINIRFDIYPSIESDLYFGTPTAMLALPRTIDGDGYIRPTIECIVKHDDVQIIARCGDDQLDISTSFSVGLANATGAASADEQIARGVSTLGALVGAGANIAAGNYIGGALSVATALVPKDKAPNAQYKNNGDGLTTWKKWTLPINDQDINLRYPIGVTEYPSIDPIKEANNVIKNGAIINAFISSIPDVINGFAFEAITASTAYVKATVDVEDVPLDAANYIAQEFEGGLELIAV